MIHEVTAGEGPQPQKAPPARTAVYWRRKQPPFEKWRLLSNFNRCMLKGTAVGAADPSFTEEGR